MTDQGGNEAIPDGYGQNVLVPVSRKIPRSPSPHGYHSPDGVPIPGKHMTSNIDTSRKERRIRHNNTARNPAMATTPTLGPFLRSGDNLIFVPAFTHGGTEKEVLHDLAAITHGDQKFCRRQGSRQWKRSAGVAHGEGRGLQAWSREGGSPPTSHALLLLGGEPKRKKGSRLMTRAVGTGGG